MNQADVDKLKHGVYLVRWANGGVSVGVVGSLHSGKRWLACANWTSAEHSGVASSAHWGRVSSMEMIAEAPYDEDFQHPYELGRLSAFEEAALYLVRQSIDECGAKQRRRQSLASALRAHAEQIRSKG